MDDERRPPDASMDRTNDLFIAIEFHHDEFGARWFDLGTAVVARIVRGRRDFSSASLNDLCVAIGDIADPHRRARVLPTIETPGCRAKRVNRYLVFAAFLLCAGHPLWLGPRITLFFISHLSSAENLHRLYAVEPLDGPHDPAPSIFPLWVESGGVAPSGIWISLRFGGAIRYFETFDAASQQYRPMWELPNYRQYFSSHSPLPLLNR